MFAELISIGSELLTPDRMDTNSLWITAQLNRFGIEVRRKVIWGDEVEGLTQEIRSALDRSAIVITTGGLGPTEDDITREAVAGALGVSLVSQPDLVEELTAKFARFGRTMSPNNLKQCLLPEGATVMPNPMGTAPGITATSGTSRLFVMPGPPREMKPMFTAQVEPVLVDVAGPRRVVRQVLRVIGLGESVLDERIAPLYKGLENPKIGVLFSAFDVEVHLTATADSEQAAHALNEELTTRMREALGTHIYAETEVTLAGVLGERLSRLQESLAVVDLGTGGLVAQRLSDVTGSEGFLKLGLTLPNLEAASQWLSFDTSSIKSDGAAPLTYRAILAERLAEAVRQKVGATHGLAILAEPPDENRFGTFIIAHASKAPQAAVTVTFPGDLELRRSRAAQGALDLLRRDTLTR